MLQRLWIMTSTSVMTTSSTSQSNSKNAIKRAAVLVFFPLIFLYIPVILASSLYLPLKQQPHIEAKIERLFIAANIPIAKRPISVKRLELALNKAANLEPALSSEIHRYLQRYKKNAAITQFSFEVAADKASFQSLPNNRGQLSHSNYSASVQGYYAVSDTVKINAGFVAYDQGSDDDQVFAEGSYISIGPDYLQLDIGFRAHWLSPFQDSSMLLSSNAPSMPSLTLSNALPLNFMQMDYEVFYAQMSHSDRIRSNDRSSYLPGTPKLFGLHLGFVPVAGLSIGLNRLMQYGGADNDESISSLLRAFLAPGKNDNSGGGEGVTREDSDFGNQLTSITTRFTFPGRYPVAVYMEFAGEDTSHPSKVHIGNSSLMFGLHLPKFTAFLDASYEYAQWQNGWYINGNYPDGLIQNGTIIGHWGASRIGKGIPASTHSVKLIWLSNSRHELQAYVRRLTNDSVNTQYNYRSAYEIHLQYAYNLRGTRLGCGWLIGKDVIDNGYVRLAGFIRW